MRRNPDPVVRYRDGRALVDRRSLALLAKRSPRTIEARCPVACYTRDGRALYDAAQCQAILDTIPTRRRARELTPA